MTKILYDELQKHNIDTYGIDAGAYFPRISLQMRDTFLEAADNMEDENNRAIVQRFYDVFAQAHSLGVTDDIADEAFGVL